MAKALRFAGYGLLSLLALVLLSLAIIYGITEYQLRKSHLPESRGIGLATGPGSLSEGHRLSEVLGCTGCHGANLQGDKFFSEPNVATVYASNLTRLLPSYSDQQLEAAVRQGIRRDGSTLVGMPSSTFSSLSDDDLAQVIRYMRTFTPAGTDTPQPSIGLLGRIGLMLGEFKPEVAYVEEARTRKPHFVGARHERGRYLASVTCAECHDFDLSGHEENTPDLALAAAYDAGQFEKLMRTGKGVGNRDLGLMSRVSQGRFSKFTPQEIQALHQYLVARAGRSQPPQ